jgi:hypothetical protein
VKVPATKIFISIEKTNFKWSKEVKNKNYIKGKKG